MWLMLWSNLSICLCWFELELVLHRWTSTSWHGYIRKCLNDLIKITIKSFDLRANRHYLLFLLHAVTVIHLLPLWCIVTVALPFSLLHLLDTRVLTCLLKLSCSSLCADALALSKSR